MAYVQDVMREIADRVAPTSKNRQRIQDDSAEVAISLAADNGAGLIRITAAGHSLQTGFQAFIKGITGTTEANNTLANPAWTVTRISSSTFDLQGSTFTNAYVSGGTLVAALVGTVDYENITRQRLLDIYNQTRRLLLRIALRRYPPNTLAAMAPGFVKPTTIEFASGLATKPSGLVVPLRLAKADETIINIVPVSQRPYVESLDSATNPIVADYGRTFEALSGSTYITNASDYILEYLGLDTWTLSDVIFFSGTQTSETLSEDWIPVIVEGCAALVAGRGIAEVENILGAMIEEVIQ